MQYNFTSLIILLIGVLLMVLNENLLAGLIPSWVFILVLIVWVIVRVRTLRNPRE